MNAITNQNSIKKKIKKLENYKLEAIQKQKFEEAAVIRDRISKILSGDLTEVHTDQIIEDRHQEEKEQKEKLLFKWLMETDRLLIINTMKKLVKRTQNAKQMWNLDEVMEDILLWADSATYNGYLYDILNIFKKREWVKKWLLRVTWEEDLWKYLLELTSEDLENLKKIFVLLQEQTRDSTYGYRTVKDSLSDFELKDYIIKFWNIKDDEYTNSIFHNITNYMDHLGKRSANFEFLFGIIIEEIDECLTIKNTSGKNNNP